VVAIACRINRQFGASLDISECPKVVILIAAYVGFVFRFWIVDIPRHREPVKVSGAAIPLGSPVLIFLHTAKRS